METLRAYRIAEYVRESRFCSLADLMERFEVSIATIHRDVASLVKAGALRKVHGGVAAPEAHTDAAMERNDDSDPHERFRHRLDLRRRQKIAIARQALAEIRDGDIVFMDSSTTVFQLARALREQPFSSLTLVTNSTVIPREFPFFPASYCLIGLGGNYDLRLNAFLGRSTLRDLERLTFDKAFISARGVDAGGLYSQHENHAIFLGQVLERSRRNYLLVDGDKLGKSGIFRIAPLEGVDRIISDQPLPAYANGASETDAT